jgi:hypothetical protein
MFINVSYINLLMNVTNSRNELYNYFGILNELCISIFLVGGDAYDMDMTYA